MGIDLICGDEYFNCRYSAWKYFRYTLVAEKVLEYIQTFKKIKNSFTFILKVNFGAYNNLMDKGFFDNMDEILNISSDITKLLITEKDFLESLDMDGVIYLLNKSDCSGEYTPKESERILITIKNIRKHLITDEHEHKDVYDSIIKLFEESVVKNIPVGIS